MRQLEYNYGSSPPLSQVGENDSAFPEATSEDEREYRRITEQEMEMDDMMYEVRHWRQVQSAWQNLRAPSMPDPTSDDEAEHRRRIEQEGSLDKQGSLLKCSGVKWTAFSSTTQCQ